MKKKALLFTLTLVLLINIVNIISAVPEDIENPIFHPIDINITVNISVNSSLYWDTEDRGPLRNVADILHNWLDTTSLLWSNAEHIMDALLDMNGYNIEMEGGDIEMDGGDLLNVQNITLIDSIKDSDTDSRLYFDDEGTLVSWT